MQTTIRLDDGWNTPDEKFKRNQAMEVIPYVYFLDRRTALELMLSNRRIENELTQKFRRVGIRKCDYFWKYNACSFPGFRRKVGKEKKWIQVRNSALLTDDNTFTKHLWYYLRLGRGVGVETRSGWTLAHVVDHKIYFRERIRGYFGNRERRRAGEYLSGLFSSVPNTIYLPTVLSGISDENEYLRDLLVMISQKIYGRTIALFPHKLEYKFLNKAKTMDEFNKVWNSVNLVRFDKNNFQKFLKFRKKEYSKDRNLTSRST